LGFLAGDYIKECSDLCLPLVAVGCMYPEGYLRQRIGSGGGQENLVESIKREAALFLLTLKTWSFGPGQSKNGYAQDL